MLAEMETDTRAVDGRRSCYLLPVNLSEALHARASPPRLFADPISPNSSEGSFSLTQDARGVKFSTSLESRAREIGPNSSHGSAV